MKAQTRERVGDWLIVAGAVALFCSLFLTWSHQISAPFRAEWARTGALANVPSDPTAWQLYSVSDVLLAVVAAALVAVALMGAARARLAVALVAALMLAFTIHAMAVPPTNGVNLDGPAPGNYSYVPDRATAGLGEVVAIAALGAAIAGLGISKVE